MLQRLWHPLPAPLLREPPSRLLLRHRYRPCRLSAHGPATFTPGYASNYTCRGIVASHALVGGDNVIPAGVNLNYKLNDANSIVGAASYTSLTSGHELLGEKDISFHNETNFNLGWKNQDGLLKNLSTTVGWNLIHGGLLGNFAKYDYSGVFTNGFVGKRHAHSVAQEFYVNLNYDVCKNWFAGVTTSYAFRE